jgi:hypothetical protein
MDLKHPRSNKVKSSPGSVVCLVIQNCNNAGTDFSTTTRRAFVAPEIRKDHNFE